MLTLGEITDPNVVAGMEDTWNGVAKQCADATIFQSWEWNWTWWQHYGKGSPWILTAHDGDRLVGFLPLFVAKTMGLRWARFMGGMSLANRADAITLPEYDAECRRLFAEEVSRQKNRWDLYELLPIPEERAPSLHPAGTFESLTSIMETDYTVDLPGDEQSFDATLEAKFKRNLRRRRKMLAGELHAAVESVACEDEATIEATMTDLYRLHEMRWEGHELFFVFGPTERAFHAAIAKAAAKKGWLRLYRVVIDGVTRAVHYGFQFATNEAAYATRFDPELHRFGLGILLVEHAMRAAISNGVTRFDLMKGREDWKRFFAAKESKLLHLEVKKPTVRSGLAFTMNRGLYRLWQEMIDERYRLLEESGGARTYWIATHGRLLASAVMNKTRTALFSRRASRP